MGKKKKITKRFCTANTRKQKTEGKKQPIGNSPSQKFSHPLALVHQIKNNITVILSHYKNT